MISSILFDKRMSTRKIFPSHHLCGMWSITKYMALFCDAKYKEKEKKTLETADNDYYQFLLWESYVFFFDFKSQRYLCCYLDLSSNLLGICRIDCVQIKQNRNVISFLIFFFFFGMWIDFAKKSKSLENIIFAWNEKSFYYFNIRN